MSLHDPAGPESGPENDPDRSAGPTEQHNLTDWPPAESLASDESERAGTYCEHCSAGPFEGLHGLRAHTGQVHPDLEPAALSTDSRCCRGHIINRASDSLPTACADCGLVLEGRE